MKFLELASGLSVLGQPIKAYRSTIEAKKYLYLIAGVHGDEVEGAYVLEKLGGKNNLTDAIERGLNFTAGYSSADKSFCQPTDTVMSCFQNTLASSFNQNDFNNRKFFYTTLSIIFIY